MPLTDSRLQRVVQAQHGRVEPSAQDGVVQVEAAAGRNQTPQDISHRQASHVLAYDLVEKFDENHGLSHFISTQGLLMLGISSVKYEAATKVSF